MRVNYYDDNHNLIWVDVLSIIYCPINEKYYCSGLRGIVHVIPKDKMIHISI